MKIWIRLAAVAAIGFSVAACSGGNAEASDASDAPVSEVPAAEQPAAAAAPAPTGKVVEVKMITDAKGNYFEPAELTVSQGDVVRFTLVSGLHNVSFPADQNAAASGLPEASPYLQAPGQTYDVTVAMPAGEYAFQCDPHAALGMVGKLTVR